MAELKPFAERAEAVLSQVFGGMHHCRNVHRFFVGTEMEMWEFNTFQELSTFDSNRLTELVIAAHDQCVRVTVGPSGPKRVKIQMWPRKGREGKLYNRHPTIEQAIETARRAK
jgi:hypothetical protein